MKYKKLKILSYALSSVLSVTCLSGCSIETSYNSARFQEESGVVMTEQFEPGKHVISVPMPDTIDEGIIQLENYPGYEIIGMSCGSYGKSVGHYAGGAVLYVNTVPVICETSLYDENGNLAYLDFGTPLDYNDTITEDDCDIHDFDIGEHVISVPIEEDITTYNNQYECPEGYEVIGISVSTYGQSVGHYDTGIILYKNVTPVRVSKSENGYVSFGTPIAQIKGLSKK